MFWGEQRVQQMNVLRDHDSLPWETGEMTNRR